MEAKVRLIEPLLEKVEEYGKTNLELLKLKFVHRTADVTSTLMSRLVIAIVLMFALLALNTGIALWLGDVLGKSYYGFLIVASVYGLAGILLFFIHPYIKSKVNNSLIIEMLN